MCKFEQVIYERKKQQQHDCKSLSISFHLIGTTLLWDQMLVVIYKLIFTINESQIYVR